MIPPSLHLMAKVCNAANALAKEATRVERARCAKLVRRAIDPDMPGRNAAFEAVAVAIEQGPVSPSDEQPG